MNINIYMFFINHRKIIGFNFLFNIMIINIAIIIIILLTVIYLFYKATNQFWSRQPVFHFHNLKYWLFPPGIIQKNLPQKDKFYNTKIQFDSFNNLKTEKKALFISFISSHFMPKKYELYKPTEKSIVPYFECNNDKSFISLYIQKTRKNNNMLVSTMTTRPLDCFINGEKMNIYYVDFLCVHKDKRKQGIAPEIIYSHYVNQRNKHKNVVFLFKRESDSTFIVPVTVYKTYGFDMKYWNKNIKFDQPNIKTVIINDANLNLIIDILNKIDKSFSCVIKPISANIKHLLLNKNIFISCVTINNKPICLYVFRNTYTTYNGKESLELITSFLDKDYINMENIFVLGALISIDKLVQLYNYKILFIENISNNNIILKNILERYTYIFSINHSFYFYNFCIRPFMSTDVFMIT